MKLISPFKTLLQGGVTLTLKLSAAGSGENVQLDILPQGKDSATGVSLPPVALVGTAEEIDAQLEGYLQKYAASVTRVADVVANADAELQRLEAEASALTKKVIAEKAKKAPTPTAPSKTATTQTRKDPLAGLLDEDDEASTTLIPTGGSAEGASAAGSEVIAQAASAPATGLDSQGEGVSADTFQI